MEDSRGLCGSTSDEDLRKAYEEALPTYKRLEENLHQTITLLAKQNDIEVHAIEHRTKEFQSFCDKICRKGYTDPFHQTEDLCGIRIICTFKSELIKIDRVIKEEFVVRERTDKAELLEDNEFGYRSNHYIIEIRKDWLSTPQYRGLEDVRAEIQVRTILEHAWADVQHKLAYKNETHVPRESKRKFGQLMALLELADESFDSLNNQKRIYREEMNKQDFKSSSEGKDKYPAAEMNQDTIQTILDSLFPDRERNEIDAAKLLDELVAFKLTPQELIDAHHKAEHTFPRFDELLAGARGVGCQRFTQVGMARMSLDYAYPDYHEWRRGSRFALIIRQEEKEGKRRGAKKSPSRKSGSTK